MRGKLIGSSAAILALLLLGAMPAAACDWGCGGPVYYGPPLVYVGPPRIYIAPPIYAYPPVFYGGFYGRPYRARYYGRPWGRSYGVERGYYRASYRGGYGRGAGGSAHGVEVPFDGGIRATLASAGDPPALPGRQ